MAPLHGIAEQRTAPMGRRPFLEMGHCGCFVLRFIWFGKAEERKRERMEASVAPAVRNYHRRREDQARYIAFWLINLHRFEDDDDDAYLVLCLSSSSSFPVSLAR